MATILVTGGAGYVGAHACKALKAAGHVPVTFDNLVTGWADSVRFGPFESGDLSDRARLDAVFDRYRPDAVMHFAALAQVGASVADPGRYWRNNVAGSLTLVEAAVAAGCLRFVFSSTCAVYGNAGGAVLDETAAQAPISPYAASKRAVEDILTGFSHSHGLRHVIFRYFNVAGADPDGEAGEQHHPETHLIPLLLAAADGSGAALTLYGTDYDTPDGTCIRDYVHVSDLADAHVLGLGWLQDGRGDAVFNLGTGQGFSVQDVIAQVRAVTGSAVPVIPAPRRAGDVARLVAGGTLARQQLGWKPHRSTLPQMIGDAWHWHRTGRHEQ